MSLRIATFNVENLMNRFDFSGFRNELRQDRRSNGKLGLIAEAGGERQAVRNAKTTGISLLEGYTSPGLEPDTLPGSDVETGVGPGDFGRNPGPIESACV